MADRIEPWQKPPVSKPVVNELQRDISQNALSQMVTYFGQMSPQITGRSIDGAAPIDVYQNGEYVGTVSSIDFGSGTATASGSAPSDGAGGAGSTGGVVTFSSGVPPQLSGTGSPEGAVSAGVGSLYLRIDGGAGTTLYVKESGSGTSGWIAK